MEHRIRFLFRPKGILFISSWYPNGKYLSTVPGILIVLLRTYFLCMWFETQTVLLYTYEINAEHARHDRKEFFFVFEVVDILWYKFYSSSCWKLKSGTKLFFFQNFLLKSWKSAKRCKFLCDSLLYI